MTIVNLYTEKLNQPESIGSEDIPWLENIINNYPYFQSARALYLKGLYEERSHLYNSELKKTAAYTTDRDVLFELITSDKFHTYEPINIHEVEVNEEIFIQKKPTLTLEKNIEKSVLSTIAYIETSKKEDELISKLEQRIGSKGENSVEKSFIITAPPTVKTVEILEEELEVGKPLDFQKNEKHTFAEWLQLTKAKPIDRSENTRVEYSEEKSINIKNERTKKLELIDRFIENNPKIIPSKQPVSPPTFVEREENSPLFLMTETLAKIYLEQKKYQKAIQAYEILILKYPEKSSLFADRMEHIKKLQQYNS